MNSPPLASGATSRFLLLGITVSVTTQRTPSSLIIPSRLFPYLRSCSSPFSRSYPGYPLGSSPGSTAQLSQGTWTDPPAIAFQSPAAGRAAAQWRRPLNKGRGCWEESSAVAAAPAAHTLPPLAGPTLFRTVGCACSVGTETLLSAPHLISGGESMPFLWLCRGRARYSAPPSLPLPAKVPIGGEWQKKGINIDCR